MISVDIIWFPLVLSAGTDNDLPTSLAAYAASAGRARVSTIFLNQGQGVHNPFGFHSMVEVVVGTEGVHVHASCRAWRSRTTCSWGGGGCFQCNTKRGKKSTLQHKPGFQGHGVHNP
eukprot:SAG22_NODE_14_length_33165_cov_13.196698_5_plen_117_part_00